MKVIAKCLILILTIFLFKIGFSQVNRNNKYYNLFSCKDCKNKLFATSNSGIRNTPLGLRIGFLCKTGLYIGTRFGPGEVYNEYTGNTSKTRLFSITGGFTKPIYIRKNFSSYYFLGGGYGQWWKYRRDGWTNEGYELEGGLMFSVKKIMLCFSANMLDGYKTNATWDFTIGLGYRFL